MIYPSLIKVAFDLFNCFEIEEGESWLLHDLQLRCWQSDHLLWSLIIGIPIIFFWVIGIPIAALKTLRHNKAVLFEPSTLAKYKVMYQGLKP